MPARVRELTELRTRESKHFLNDDGTNTAEISAGSRHYQATPGGSWLDKVQQFRAGSGTAEWISDTSDVTMRAYQTGTGAGRRWWVEFKETLTGKGIAFELSTQPAATAGSKALSFGGGWTYTHTRAGGKLLSAPIAAAEGPKSFTFGYSLIGGADPLTLQADGSIRCGNVFTMAAPFLEGADSESYPASSWALDPVASTLSFSYTDANLPVSAYPYRVDPSTTFTVAAAADSQYVRKTGAAYPPTSAMARSGTTDANVSAVRELNAGVYAVNCGLLRWDTSSLPDDVVVTAPTIRVITVARDDADARNITADWYQWDGASTTDYSETSQTGALAASDLTLISATAGVSNDIVLDNATGVSLTGITRVRLHLSGDVPLARNRAVFASEAHATYTAPQLIVPYTTPDAIPPAAPQWGSPAITLGEG